MGFKKIKISNILFYLIILCFCSSPSADQFYTVKSIIDGDTIILSNQKFIRYIGIDSPEINHKTGVAEPFGFEAKKINEKLISKKTIRLEYDIQEKDHFGRVLAYVYTRDGTFINKEIIQNGYAWILFKPPNTKHGKELLFSQRDAMNNKLGIWGNLKEKKGTKYIGNVSS
ncbi:MAG: thermonuclease family protein, partial [Desulfobacterales bacterium]|nr:thermonuclease family protein [Desulfobacterales bacterium]